MMSDLYLIRKVTILKKIQVRMKTFIPPFSNHFSLSLNRKKCLVMRAMRMKQNNYASAANLLHIRIGNLDWRKCRHCKNEAREIDCLCLRAIEVNAVLVN